MSGIVEQIARDVAASWNCEPDDLIGTEMPAFIGHSRLGAYGPHYKLADEKYMPAWKYFIPMARAAIEAMRVPSDEMCAVGAATWNDDLPSELNAMNMWRLMIDEALK